MNFFKKIPQSKFFKKGFTLVELLVSISIFAVVTGLVLVQHDKFNGGIVLTNLAYDVALTIREAQFYGINVKQALFGSGSSFNATYGVHFTSNKGNDQHRKFVFFTDRDDTPQSYGLSNTFHIQRGNYISSLCVGEGNACTNTAKWLEVRFKRPDPEALIKSSVSGAFNYAEIQLMAPNGQAKKIVVRKTGQIEIQ